MTSVFLALGSNLGDRLANLQAGIDRLALAGVHPRQASGVWETPPVPADQPAFLNAVLAVETEMVPEALLRAAKQIEWDLGRRPGRRWGPRPIDIDILFFGDQRIATPDLTVPHASIPDRAFVLVPLAELREGPLPVLGVSARTLLEPLDQSGMTRLSEALRLPA